LPVKIKLKKTSFIDFPARISSVFFFSGCNLRCPWCHNRELITGEAEDLVGLEEGLAHVRKRRGVLGGVVLSGGEPCLYEELPLIINEIKNLSLPVKLDTNGMFPAMLERLFSREETRPDYIALDLKIAPARYAELGGPPDSSERLTQSAALIHKAIALANSVGAEYRTLALPGGYISAKDIEALAPLADNAPWYFRPFAGGNCLDPAWDLLEEPAAESRARLEALAEKARELGKRACVPGM
jgi:pyruvate formate lyase activating enzyme